MIANNLLDEKNEADIRLSLQRLTVGKIYAGLLILENWRAKKSGTEVRLSSKSLKLKLISKISHFDE